MPSPVVRAPAGTLARVVLIVRPIDERWQSFIAFWLVAGLALLALGIAVFVAVHDGHRVGGVLLLVGIICLAIGLSVRRAGRRGE